MTIRIAKLMKRCATKFFRRHRQQPAFWYKRWDTAIRWEWLRLYDGEPTEEKFKRFERNHKRLCRLIEAKNSTLSQPMSRFGK